jgi:uncharacterized membrane protein
MKKLIKNLCIASSLLAGAIVFDIKPANAWADFCNDTGEAIFVSFGTPNDSGNWQSFGWYRLRDNSCHRFYPHDLRARGVGRLYYFVQNTNGRNITPSVNLGGFCVNSRKGFSYTSNDVSDFCGSNGTRVENFAGFDVGNVRNTLRGN